MATEKTVFIGLRVPKEMAEAVKKHAESLDRSISWITREYLRQGLERDRLIKRKR